MKGGQGEKDICEHDGLEKTASILLRSWRIVIPEINWIWGRCINMLGYENLAWTWEVGSPASSVCHFVIVHVGSRKHSVASVPWKSCMLQSIG